MNKVIALEGNIGVGKSTVCQKFKMLNPTNCSVYKEQGNEKFLNLFYSNPRQYAFAYQWGMLKTRQYQLQLAQQDSKYGRIPAKQFYVWDRSMVGDYIFALWNHLLGSISAAEMSVYEDEFGGSIKDLESVSFLQVVDCYVLLNDEPENCKYRVENLRGNKSESNIPMAYYEGIDDIHFALFVQRLIPLRLAPVVVLTWGQYHDPKILWNYFLEIVAKKKEGCKVDVLQALPSEIDTKTQFVYDSEDSIVQVYELIKSFRKDQEHVTESRELTVLKQFQTIYIPSDLMIISPKEKCIIENDYGINFYRNEFKRVVLWHLSRGQHVCLYRKTSST